LPRPRLLLADDHALVIAGFRRLLEPEFEVVAAVEDGRELVKRARELDPDVILLDISMPLLNGFEAARQIRKSAAKAKLVFVTMHGEPDYVAEAFRSGASGYLLKSSAASELVTAIREALNGGTYLTPLIPSAAMEGRWGETGGERFKLTSRQREVLQLVAEGKATKEIAGILNISINTVEFHKSAIMQKLRLHSIAELTRYAIEHGISGL
jgi:DNA-binding NarL/FixJ family response regulator